MQIEQHARDMRPRGQLRPIHFLRREKLSNRDKGVRSARPGAIPPLSSRRPALVNSPVNLLPRTRVQSIDRAGRVVVPYQGRVAYSRLVLAIDALGASRGFVLAGKQTSRRAEQLQRMALSRCF